MNEELEPLGMPESAQGEGPHTLSELISQHPLAAVVASAAVGAGVVALIAAASQRRDGPRLASQVQDQAADTYAELRSQLARLVERFAAAMPTTAEAEKAAADLGAQASSTWDTALDTARRALQGTVATGAQATQAATQTAMAHPVLTSIVVGAIGTAVASLAAQRRQAHDGDGALRPVPNGHDSSPATTAGTSPSL